MELESSRVPIEEVVGLCFLAGYACLLSLAFVHRGRVVFFVGIPIALVCSAHNRCV